MDRGDTAGKDAGPSNVTRRGTVGYQLVRDTALFNPANIRWVFDGSKVNKNTVIDLFEKLIASDDYLKRVWIKRRPSAMRSPR